MTATSLRSMGLFSCALVLVAGAAGCGVDVSGVFASSDNNTSTAGSGPGGGGGQGGDGGTPTTTGEGGSGGTTGATTSSSTASTTSSTTTTTTAPPKDVGCGNTTCPIPDDICCWDKHGFGTGNKNYGQCFDAPVSPFDCNTKVENGGIQTVISCQNADDCDAGQKCCGEVVTFQYGQSYSYYPVVECRNSCSWPTRVMCKTNGSSAECPVENIQGQNVQTVCGPSTILPEGYFVCRPPP